MKLPSFQFYPGDWMKDPALRACTIAARGLWIDMLCLMFECDRRGYLQYATGSPVNAEQLARMTGCSTDDVTQLLQELETAGVFSRSEHGVIYSRRIVRDESKRSKCAEAGRRGGGNPTFKGHSKGEPKGTAKGQPKGAANPSSSSTSTSTSTSPSGKEEPPLPPLLNTPIFRAAWGEWRQHRREIKKPLTPTALAQQLQKLAAWGLERAIAAIRHSMANGWQGIFEPTTKGSVRHATENWNGRFEGAGDDHRSREPASDHGASAAVPGDDADGEGGV